jgi:hypothetical protein
VNRPEGVEPTGGPATIDREGALGGTGRLGWEGRDGPLEGKSDPGRDGRLEDEIEAEPRGDSSNGGMEISFGAGMTTAAGAAGRRGPLTREGELWGATIVD